MVTHGYCNIDIKTIHKINLLTSYQISITHFLINCLQNPKVHIHS